MRLLLTTSILSILAIPSQAQLYKHTPSEENAIKPRVELNHRYSNERAITMMEFWVPLGQNEVDGSVLFGDLRMMGDNNDSREFNVGVGYREIVETKLLGEGVMGGMLWFDRRLTAVDSKFNQVTAGLEWLAEDYDIRLNGYMPLNRDKSFTRANPNGAGLGFVGNQIIVNTDQSVVEEALPGLDLEIGVKLDFMDNITDATRVYVGGYHFEGDRADDVTGYRARIASDITEDIQIGARFQKDDTRGSQGYLEATIRLPFGNKKSFQKEGLRARLDESPERDIDIVATSAVLEDGLDAKILNANTSVVQNVIHVDNTAPGGGDGSVENPFNNITDADAVAVANDLIYVRRGDGTTSGHTTGINLNDDGQMLIGSGTNLTFDRGRFKASNDANISSGIIVAKKTNDNPVFARASSGSVDVSANNVYVSGVTFDGTAGSALRLTDGNNAIIENVIFKNNTSNGILALYNNVIIDKLTIRNNVFDNNNSGFNLSVSNTATVGELIFENNSVLNSGNDGVRVNVLDAGSRLNKAIINNNVADNNADDGGFVITTQSAGEIGDLLLTNNVASNHVTNGYGLNVQSNGAGSRIENLIFRNNVANNNNDSGIRSYALAGGTIDKITYDNNSVSSNDTDGIQNRADTNSTINTIILKNNFSFMNADDGYEFISQNTSNINNVIMTSNTSNMNADNGLRVNAETDANVNKFILNNNIFSNSGDSGINLNDVSAAGHILIDMGGGAFGALGQNSVFGSADDEMRLDIDGALLKAENNFWGSSNGLLSGKTLLIDGSTIDTTPFLEVKSQK